MSKFQVLNDPKVETVLAQLYQKADRQSKSLLFHYLLPQIPNLLIIYLATAVRDNGGGTVIGTEIVPEKVQQARKNIAEAGLEAYVEIREGDALETLKNLNKTVDMLLIDGWPHLALDIFKLVSPFLRKGGIIITDNIGSFKEELTPYVEFLQNPDNGYRSTTLNLKGGTEFSLKI